MAEHAFDVVISVKLVVQVKLLPTPVPAAALEATLHACNAAAEYTSQVAFERNVKSRNELQKLCYRETKGRFGLSAQPAVRVVKKVVDAYTALDGSIRAGTLGDKKSRRRIKAESKPIAFRATAAQSSWPFQQLEQHITYKARRVGVPVLLVDARYTSQMCPRCKHTACSNRLTRDSFSCRRCGLAGPADVVAAVNIRDRARRAWVLVNVPIPMAAQVVGRCGPHITASGGRGTRLGLKEPCASPVLQG